MFKQLDAGSLRVAYHDSGDSAGVPVILLHGFPYDVHAYDDVGALLRASGCRVVVPYLRGFGPTRFLHAGTPRSGQQAALADDLRSFIDALGLTTAVLAGYDWGGRAACIVSALWPERVRALVTVNGYNLQNIALSGTPISPQAELRLWYQYYFHGARGRTGLECNRDALCKLLWSLWSPNWRFDDATFERSAVSFANPDFVDVVIHSYRHRYGLVPGDPALESIEQQLAAQPPIRVPAIAMVGAADGVMPADGCENHGRHFSARYERRVVAVAGHNLPQEAPQAFAAAVLALL